MSSSLYYIDHLDNLVGSSPVYISHLSVPRVETHAILTTFTTRPSIPLAMLFLPDICLLGPASYTRVSEGGIVCPEAWNYSISDMFGPKLVDILVYSMENATLVVGELISRSSVEHDPWQAQHPTRASYWLATTGGTHHALLPDWLLPGNTFMLLFHWLNVRHQCLISDVDAALVYLEVDIL